MVIVSQVRTVFSRLYGGCVERPPSGTSSTPVYHRKESRTQTVEDTAKQEASGEIWGKAPRGSDIPKVQAYSGPLKDGQRSIEFTTDVPPDRGGFPRLPEWSGPRDGVAVDGEFARITVRITKNTQRGD